MRSHYCVSDTLIRGFFGAMKSIGLLFLLVFATSVIAQSPVKETLAYSRDTIPGIPGVSPSQNPFPTSYYIYVVIKKGAPILATGACVRGKSYAATLKSVGSPVLIERDPGVPTGEKEILVKRTPDDVYQVELGEPRGSVCKESAEEKVAQPSEVEVFLKSGEAKWCGRAEKIVPLHPAHAM